MKHNILVFSSLFPSKLTPNNGLFIRERMFRVAKHTNLIVVSPKPWFPGQQLLRFFKKNYRPEPERIETQQGITVYFPRFLSFPGFFRNLDAFLMYICCFSLVKRLKNEHNIDIIDSHFTFPDGLAATYIAQKLSLKSVITLRGTEIPHSMSFSRRKQLLQAWKQADKIFSVSDSLRRHTIRLGADAEKFKVIGNGIDTDKFKPLEKTYAKKMLGIESDTKVLITVGGLVERKGFHRVIACIPQLLKKHPKLLYLVVGGHQELIQDGKNWYFIQSRRSKADEASSLANSVLTLLNSPNKWQNLRLQGCLFVETERNWPISVARYESVYNRALNKRTST